MRPHNCVKGTRVRILEWIIKRIGHAAPWGRVLICVNGKFIPVKEAIVADKAAQTARQRLVSGALNREPQRYDREVRIGDVLLFLTENDRNVFLQEIGNASVSEKDTASEEELGQVTA